MEHSTEEQIHIYRRIPFAKIRNKSTTAIEQHVMPPQINQGIWIDIFPMDDACDGEGFTTDMLKIEKELYACVYALKDVTDYILSDQYQSAIPKGDIRDILKLPKVEQFRIYEQIINSFDGKSSMLSIKHYEMSGYKTGAISKNCFKDTVQLIFEGYELPAPIGYEEVLSYCIGDDWRVPRITHNHGAIYDPDTPYIEYFNGSNIKNDGMGIDL